MADDTHDFRFHFTSEREVRVSANPHHYGKSLEMVNRLAAKLKEKVPFPYEIKSGPDVRMLDGNRERGIIVVEMTIRHQLDDEHAEAQLRAHGFSNGRVQFFIG